MNFEAVSESEFIELCMKLHLIPEPVQRNRTQFAFVDNKTIVVNRTDKQLRFVNVFAEDEAAEASDEIDDIK